MTTAIPQMPSEDLEVQESIQENPNQSLDLDENQRRQKIIDIKKEFDLKPFYLEQDKQETAKSPFIGGGQTFKNVQLEVPEGETTAEYLGRQTLRTVVAGTSAFLGLPGDLIKLPSTVGELSKELLPERAKKVYEGVTRYGLLDPKVAEKIPGSQEIRSGITSLLGLMGVEPETLEATTRLEKIGDEVVSDLATLFVPLGGLKRAAKIGEKSVQGVNILRDSFMSKLGTAALMTGGGVGAKELVKDVGGGDLAQGSTKLGTALLLGIATKGAGTRRLAQGLRERATATIPEGEVYNNTRALRSNLRRLIGEFEAGGIVLPSNEAALQEARYLLNGLSRGTATPRDLVKGIDRLNELRFAYTKDGRLIKRPPKEAAAMNRVFDVYNEALTDYGRTQNPDFLRTFRNSQGVYRADALGNQLANNLQRAGMGEYSPLLKAAFGYTTGGTYGALATLAGGASFRSLSQTLSALKTAATSPVAREYYLKVLQASAENNIPAMQRNLLLLDKKLKEEEKELLKKYPTIELDK